MANTAAGVKPLMKERNNQKQGRSGSKVKTVSGPVKSASGNATKKGGVFRPTKGKM